MRLARQQEKARWRELMAKHHYLGFQPIVGQSLWYVACVGDEWIALLGWGSAALKCGVRDRWIGWDRAVQWRRLRWLANNVRFLILPGWHRPNLASQVLAANIRRLSDDWQRCHGHRLLLAETFVDRERFKGTCYRASGWHELGDTRGFSKRNTGYWYHGQCKRVFVRELVSYAASGLAAPFLPPLRKTTQEIPMLDVNTLTLAGQGGLMELLERMTDPRKPRGVRHSVATVLGIAVCAALTGARSFNAIAEWAEGLSAEGLRLLGSKRKTPPSEPTIRRVLQRLDAQTIDRHLGQWLLANTPRKAAAVALDGKTLRGAHDTDERAPHLLSALLHKDGVVIGQVSVEAKTNEIPKLPELLKPLPPADTVVTADALHTQSNSARYIVEHKKADYLFTVKDNQPRLRDDIAQLNLPSFPPGHETIDKAHGRLETRRIWVSTELNDYLGFPYVGQVFTIERRREPCNSGTVSHEIVQGVTSLTPENASPERLLELNRGHWAIENRLHWVRDVTFDEDRCRIRRGAGAHVMASLRNLAISILRRAGARYIPPALRQCARADDTFVFRLIGLRL